ncbi:MAG: MBL fold metallo-hydrolase [Oscillospiraceae bacterium]|nr:MBL fold metallo-hydrolase [Oscillospiraceae bacterium]
MDGMLRLTVLGTRGSCPVSGADKRLFGGASSCYMLEAGDQTLFLDAGSGLLKVPSAALRGRRVTILLSHTHIDHILGLPCFSALTEQGREIALYCRSCGDLDAAQQLARFLSPPLWPCRIGDYPARLLPCELPEDFCLGDLRIRSAESDHPGGAALLRLDRAGKSLVYATDFEANEAAAARLIALAGGADLLLCDAQFTEAEYDAHRGYGHSTAAMALRIACEAGVGRLLLIHHAPARSDAELLAMERALPDASARYAREGDVIEL